MRAKTEADRLSRRRFVGYGAATALAAQCAKADTLTDVFSQRGVAPTGNPQSTRPNDDEARIAAANDAAQRMTVPVMIGGRGPYRFVVDTGADRSVIADDVAASLGLIRGNNVTVQGVVRSVASNLVAVADIAVGPIIRRNMSLPILPRSMMGADGYLGLDAVDGARVTLDFENRSLDVSRSQRTSSYRLTRPQEAYVPVRGNMGHLRSLNCRVDSVSTTCFLDTGAEISVGNTRLFRALVAENPDYRVLGTLPITGITGGVIMGKVIRIDRIRLHSVNFGDAVVAIADMEIFNVWGLSQEPALLIGMNFLRQFQRVSIDYGQKEIRFDMASMMLARSG